MWFYGFHRRYSVKDICRHQWFLAVLWLIVDFLVIFCHLEISCPQWCRITHADKQFICGKLFLFYHTCCRHVCSLSFSRTPVLGFCKYSNNMPNASREFLKCFSNLKWAGSTGGLPYLANSISVGIETVAAHYWLQFCLMNKGPNSRHILEASSSNAIRNL